MTHFRNRLASGFRLVKMRLYNPELVDRQGLLRPARGVSNAYPLFVVVESGDCHAVIRVIENLAQIFGYEPWLAVLHDDANRAFVELERGW